MSPAGLFYSLLFPHFPMPRTKTGIQESLSVYVLKEWEDEGSLPEIIQDPEAHDSGGSDLHLPPLSATSGLLWRVQVTNRV